MIIIQLINADDDLHPFVIQQGITIIIIGHVGALRIVNQLTIEHAAVVLAATAQATNVFILITNTYDTSPYSYIQTTTGSTR